MKKYILFSLLLVIFILLNIYTKKSYIKQKNIDLKRTTEIHFEVGFNNSLTKIYLNDKIIYTKKLTTNESTALADVFECDYNFNANKISIVVESDSITLDLTSRYLLVGFDTNKKKLWYYFLDNGNTLIYD